MHELRKRVAVITGAASGFGRSFALACARQGMHLTLLDVDEQGLEKTAALLQGLNVDTMTLRCDVSKAEDVAARA
jgi:NAD(P)-dependent dehydrogenase (short-subunit alcohol dehydrogenase family)